MIPQGAPVHITHLKMSMFYPQQKSMVLTLNKALSRMTAIFCKYQNTIFYFFLPLVVALQILVLQMSSISDNRHVLIVRTDL